MKWNNKLIATAVTTGVLVIGTSLYADDKSKSGSSSSSSSSKSSSSSSSSASRPAPAPNPSVSTSTSTSKSMQTPQDRITRILPATGPQYKTSTTTPQQAIDNWNKSGKYDKAAPVPLKPIVVPPPARQTEVPVSKMNPQGSREVQRGIDQTLKNQSKKN